MKDAAARLTPLGLMVLALLKEGDMHPYEMIRLMRHRHDDRLLSITNGTLYHTVARLERLAFVDEIGVDRDGNRPERTIYRLTDTGRKVVVEWVRRELPRVDRPAEFRIALAESHNLERDEVIDLLHERRAALSGDELLHRSGLANARGRAVPEQFLLEIERQTFLLDAELRWTDELIARIERSAFPWGIAELDPMIHSEFVARKATLT